MTPPPEQSAHPPLGKGEESRTHGEEEEEKEEEDQFNSAAEMLPRIYPSPTAVCLFGLYREI